jgi:beta-galactosidase/beta-glucuronidase
VKVDGVLHKYTGTPDEFAKWMAKLEVESRVYRTLSAAIEAYASGAADYTDAYEQLKVLCGQHAISAVTYKHLMGDIDAFIDNPIASTFGDDWGQLESCINSIWLAREKPAAIEAAGAK